MRQLWANEVTAAWERYLTNREPRDYLTLYVQIPYCVRKCDFCIYHIRDLRNAHQLDETLDLIERQVRFIAPVFRGTTIEASGFGGGTPSLLSVAQMERLFDLLTSHFDLKVSDDNMHTFEISPESIDQKKFECLERSFINRIGMGIQTFDPDVLRSEDRIITPRAKLITALEYIRDNFRAANIDLIFRLQGMTDEIALADIETLLDLGVQMVTINKLRRREVDDLDEDLATLLTRVENERYWNPGRDRPWPAPRLIRRDLRPFRYLYNPQPRDFNSILGFGERAQSAIIPDRVSYIFLPGRGGVGRYELFAAEDPNPFGKAGDLDTIRETDSAPDEVRY